MPLHDVTGEPDWPSQALIQEGVEAYERENGPVRGAHGRGVGAAMMVAVKAERERLSSEIENLPHWRTLSLEVDGTFVADVRNAVLALIKQEETSASL